MTDNQPLEPQFEDDQPDGAAFLTRDEYGNRKRYIHLGNYERKQLGNVLRSHLIDMPWGNPDALRFWRNLHTAITEDLDDL